MAGLSVSVFFVWFFLLATRKGVRSEAKGRYQEASIKAGGAQG